jgi:hypothetical protein
VTMDHIPAFAVRTDKSAAVNLDFALLPNQAEPTVYQKRRPSFSRIAASGMDAQTRP